MEDRIRCELEKIGWVIECASPLEIRHSASNSFATNIAAEIIIDEITKVLNGERILDIGSSQLDKRTRRNIKNYTFD